MSAPHRQGHLGNSPSTPARSVTAMFSCNLPHSSMRVLKSPPHLSRPHADASGSASCCSGFIAGTIRRMAKIINGKPRSGASGSVVALPQAHSSLGRKGDCGAISVHLRRWPCYTPACGVHPLFAYGGKSPRWRASIVQLAIPMWSLQISFSKSVEVNGIHTCPVGRGSKCRYILHRTYPMRA